MPLRSSALLVLLAACGGATQVQSNPATAATSPAASTAGGDTPAVAPSGSDSSVATSDPPPDSSGSTADPSDDAPRADDDEKLDPLAAPVKYKGVDKPVPNLPLTVSVPSTAVIKADRSDSATVSPEGHEGYGIMSIGARGVMFEPLDKELAELEKQKLPVVSKRGSGEAYVIVYKPYPNMYTYERFFTVGGKPMECVVEGLYHRDEIPIYDAICKSAKVRKR
jgi:hypothetical protein